MVAIVTEKPTGVTVCFILHIILGIVEILTGAFIALAYAGFGAIATALVSVPAAFFFLLPVLAVAWFTFGILSFIWGYCIWTQRGWAWTASLVFAAMAIVVAGFGLLIGSYANVIPLIVIVLVLISLSTYNVRAYLGRIRAPMVAYPIPPPVMAGPPVVPAPVPLPYPPPAPVAMAPSYGPQASALPRPPPPGPPVAAWPMNCPACGAPAYANVSFCTSCGARLR